MRRSFLLFPVLLGTIVAASLAFAAQDQQIAQKVAALAKVQGKITFAVIGDNRSGNDIYQKLVTMIMERKPDFVVNTGDMIETPGNTRQWAAFWEMSKPITVPYFLVAGNHDGHSAVPLSRTRYRQEVDLPGNELYYAFTAGDSLFIVLDSFMDDQEKRIVGDQLRWLEGVLAGSKQKHTFVFLHHPLYTDKGMGRHAGDSLDKYPKDRDRLQALFVKYHVDTVFTGHEHYYRRKTIDGITHVITGGGGAPLYGKDAEGAYNHFIVVTVDKDAVKTEVVDVHGTVRDRF